MNLIELKAELDAALAQPEGLEREKALAAVNAKLGQLSGTRPRYQPEPKDWQRAAAADKD